MSGSEVAKRERVGALSYVTLAILTLFIALVSYFTRNFGLGNFWIVTGWWVHYLYVILIAAMLGRINRKLEVNPTQLAMLIWVMNLFAARQYLPTASTGSSLINTTAATFSAFAIHAPAVLSARVAGLAPPWVIPTDKDAVTAIWNGLRPGQDINWGVWIGPIVSWSLMLILISLLHVFTVFLLIGPRWTKVERLPFPMTVPASYVLSSYGSKDPSTQGRRLLNFKVFETKVFWICFVISTLIFSLPSVVTQFLPGFPWPAGGLGQYIFDLSSFTAPVLPGAYFYGNFYVPTFLILLLVPLNVTATIIIGWLVFLVIYPAAAVRLGLVPYAAGSETTPGYYGMRMPFPWTLAIGSGFMLGLGIWCIYLFRDRIKLAVDSLREKDMIEDGISVRLLTVGWIVIFVANVALWSTIGMNPVMAVIFFIFYTIWQISNSRVWSQLIFFGVECWAGLWRVTWPIGASIGAWASVPAQKSTPVFVNAMASQFGDAGCLGIGNVMTGAAGLTQWYAIAYNIKANLKEMFKWFVLAVLIIYPFYFTLHTWISHHVGAANIGELTRAAVPFGVVANALNKGVEGSAHNAVIGADFATEGGIIVAGILIVIALGFMRAKFPWFFIEPVALITIPSAYWVWGGAVGAFAARYMLFKILGPKRFEELFVPIAAGILLGFGGLVIITGAIVVSTIAVQQVALLWR